MNCGAKTGRHGKSGNEKESDDSCSRKKLNLFVHSWQTGLSHECTNNSFKTEHDHILTNGNIHVEFPRIERGGLLGN